MNSILKFSIKFLFLYFELKKCNSTCHFDQIYKPDPPYFLAKFEADSYVYLNGVNANVTIEEHMEVVAYCPTGIVLVHENVQMMSSTTEVVLKCVREQLTLSIGSDNYLAKNSHELLGCLTFSETFLFEKLESVTCDKRNYAIVTYLSDLTIILGDVCFDMQKMQTSHFHYTTRSTSSLFMTNIQRTLKQKYLQKKVEQQKLKNREAKKLAISKAGTTSYPELKFLERTTKKYEPKTEANSNVTATLPNIPNILPKRRTQHHKLCKTTIPSSIFFYTNKDTQLLFPNQGQSLIFYPSDLFPHEIYYKRFDNPFKNIKILQRFIGWPNIVNGNWRSFHQLLATHSRESGTYEVYLGTSHIAIAPNTKEKCVKYIQLQIDGKMMFVPKYIWAYVIANEVEQEFVVIGVNMPYYKYYDIDKDFPCKDICEEIEWLKPIYASRKVLTFGYLICCPTESVQQHLEGFPTVINKQRLVFE